MTSLTLLMENTVRKNGLIAEHGFSVWVEHDEGPFLFDAGHTDGYRRNAEKLRIDLSRAKAVVISHGHYDHGDGMAFFPFPDADDELRIYAHPDMFIPRLGISPTPDHTARQIGFSWHRDDLACPPASWSIDRGVRQIGSDLYLFSETPWTTDFEVPAQQFQVERNGVREQDLFQDEQILVFKQDDKISVLLGCSHPGVINILESIQTYFGGAPIHTVVGGMHLHEAIPDRLESTIDAFRRMDIQRIIPLHCTGQDAACAMRQVLGDRVQWMCVGDRLEL